MAVLIKRQITLTEDNDSGPFYNVYWSTNNGSTYTLAVDGASVYMPTVGSSVIVSVPSTFTTIKLESIGNCKTSFESGSGITTTTTTTTSPPTSVYKAERTNPLSFISVTYIDPWNTNRSTSWESDTPLYFVAKSLSNSQNATITNLGTLTEPNQVYDTGSLIGNNSFITEVTNPSNAFVHIYYFDGETKTPRFWPVSSFDSKEACMLSGSLMYGANSLTGLSVSESVGVSCGSTTTSTTSTSTTSTTTTAPPVIYGPFYSGQNEFDGGVNQGTACSSTVSWPFYTDATSVENIGFGNKIYTNSSGDIWPGNGSYYGIGTTSFTTATRAIVIQSTGFVSGVVQCNTTTTTTTTTAPIIYGPYYSGQNEFDGGVNQGTACSSTATWPFYSDEPFEDIGFSTTIYTDSGGQNEWPGNGSYYGISETSFTTAVKAIVIQPTGFVSGVVSCVTTTTTASPVTQIYSDAIPGYGNLQSCGCTGEIGTFNFQVSGQNVNIYSDMTGRLVYEDWDTGTIFIGDDLWYCITNIENTDTTISIRINNFGYITDWVDCSTTTTTTSTTTSTTTIDPNGCYEYVIECRSIDNCVVDYIDCDNIFQSFTMQYDTGFVVCALPTPNISGGTVEFLGACGLTTTTTTAGPTTTTTQSPLRNWFGSFDHLNSEQACGFGPDDFPNTYKHDGLVSYPRIGDTVYYSDGTTPLDPAWYYIFTDDKSIEVNASGIVIDLMDCSGML